MRTMSGFARLILLLTALGGGALALEPTPADLRPYSEPPERFRGDFGDYSSLLRFEDGTRVETAADWEQKRRELREYWLEKLGAPPPLIEKPAMEYLARTNRDGFVQHSVRVEIAPGEFTEGYLLLPEGEGPFAGVVVPYYEPESSVGLGKIKLRDFGSELARRGFAALCIGSPGGDARLPDTGGVECQPLLYLGYVAANCAKALGALEAVDAERIGVMGHSYGGKWAMFAAAFYDVFAAGAWSDPGIVFDETRPNVNYWEPWYLGRDPEVTRKRGVPSEGNPRTGAYKQLFEEGRDLHEVMALMAPRPFLVSGGSEDPPERWRALNRVREVYELLGAPNRVLMTNRPKHGPTPESNAVIYRFFEWTLR